MGDKQASGRFNEILDLDYEPSLIDPESEQKFIEVHRRGQADIIERIESLYPQNSGFFNYF